MTKFPDFETVEEFAEFVETHDMADYWDELEDVSGEFEFVAQRSRPEFAEISFPLPVAALHQLKTIAADQEADVSDLVRTWIAERLAQERKLHPRLPQKPIPETERPRPKAAETAAYPALRPAGAAIGEEQEPYA
ncbi:MAG: hypothetical protein H8D78_12700 [Chloroflexi bacterium]|nr:hypothetical protein [Chloroflexota bacterium]